jgi:hypothetical protein
MFGLRVLSTVRNDTCLARFLWAEPYKARIPTEGAYTHREPLQIYTVQRFFLTSNIRPI